MGTLQLASLSCHLPSHHLQMDSSMTSPPSTQSSYTHLSTSLPSGPHANHGTRNLLGPPQSNFSCRVQERKGLLPPPALQETSLFSKLQLQETQDAKSLPNNSCHHSIQPRTILSLHVQGPRGTGGPYGRNGVKPPLPKLSARSQAAASSPSPPPNPWGGPVSSCLCCPPRHFSFHSDSFPPSPTELTGHSWLGAAQRIPSPRTTPGSPCSSLHCLDERS